jgi:primosomal protein N' (replication factor Y)
VAGRAGRGPRGGRVLVQTFSPDHPAVLHAATHDYNAFVAGEMGHRREHNYPPYQRLARLIIRSKEMEAGAEFAERIASVFQTVLRTLGGSQTDVRLLGPAEAPVFRLKGYYRYHFQLQSPSPGALHKLFRAVLPTLNPPTGVELAVDVDPVNMQ